MNLENAFGHDGPSPCVGSYQSPEDVLRDDNLTLTEKREILAAWSSDRYAVPSKPWLRDIPSLPDFVVLRDILTALRKLDDDDPPPRGGTSAGRWRYRFDNAASAQADVADPAQRPLQLKVALIVAHQRNIDRYCRLLSGNLTDLERAYVHNRIAEECKELERICGRNADAGSSGPLGKTNRRRRRL